MKQRKTETLLYSAIGVALMFLIVVAVNIIASAFKVRADITADKLFTLSPGTREILRQLDAPVEIRFYASQKQSGAPSGLRTYASAVEDLLQELKQAAKGKIELKKFDPEPDSEAEELAALDGVEPQMLENGEPVYLGIAISQDPAKVALPFLAPSRERLLEYDIARAISQVSSTNKPVIGVMTPLQAFGQPMNPMMMQMRQQQQPQDPWVFISELQRDNDVRQVPMESEEIDPAIRVLLVIHPKGISDKAQYAIDQFLMRGGRLIALLDPVSLVDSRNANPMMGMSMGSSSNLEKLLKAWGFQFESAKVVADLNFATRFMRGNTPDVAPAVLSLNARAINTNDVATAQLDNVMLPFAGVFTGTPASGLKQTVLLKTTAESELVEGMTAQYSGQKIVDDFKPSGTAYTLAMRLTGRFKTAYPEGLGAGEGTNHVAHSSTNSLKESQETSVILVADADFVYDQFAAQVQNVFNQKIVIPRNGNLNFAQNLVEQMSGDNSLIGARSRSTLNRPFTRVSEMQAQANLRFKSEITKLQTELEQTQRQLTELQAKKEGGQRMILSPEQQAAIANFKQKEVQAKKRLKEVRKDLRHEIDSLENRLKWINIAGMPALVTLAGITLAIIRKKRTKAQ